MRLNNHTTVNDVHFIFVSVELFSVRSFILATTVSTIEALKLNHLTGLLLITLQDFHLITLNELRLGTKFDFWHCGYEGVEVVLLLAAAGRWKL